MANNFIELGIRESLARRLQQYGVAVPTPIQEKTIPVLLTGKDVIGEAQTGTGKTLAFVLPILEKIDPSKDEVQALILTPTRELAIQITAEIRKLVPAVGASVLAAYGGQDVEGQIRKLKTAPHIIVATPGRLLDHLGRGTINLESARFFVLDEADQMLNMGFLPDVEGIIRQMSVKRQTMLFSATMPDAVRKLAARYMKSPEDIQAKGRKITLDNIKQLVIETTDRGKQPALIQLIEQQRPYLAVVFCRTKIRAKKLNEVLLTNGISSDELHGDLTQAKREQVMRRFRDANLQILVATDVAARGLDVEGVTHIINYDIPRDGEDYIHRIGRTGRAGQKGMAITFVTPYDKQPLEKIEKEIQLTLEKRRMDASGANQIVKVEKKIGSRSGSASSGRGSERKSDSRRGREQGEYGRKGRGAGAERSLGGDRRRNSGDAARGRNERGQQAGSKPASRTGQRQEQGGGRGKGGNSSSRGRKR